MKVLFWMFIAFDQNATSKHLLSAVIERLGKAGHSVHIIQKSTGGEFPPIPENLRQYDVTTDAIPFETAEKTNLIARYLNDLKYIRACRACFHSDYDAVFISSTNVAGFAVRTIKKKFPKAVMTFNVQDLFPYNAVFSGSLKKDGPVFKVLAAMQRYGYRNADRLITISEDMKDMLVEDGVAADKIEVVYNWSYQDALYRDVDLSPVSPMFDKKHFNVVYAGNIGVMQNVSILVEAAGLMKEDRDVWFHIIGNGVHRQKLEEKARACGIGNISFWPIQPPALAPAIYSAADVNVIPLMKDVYRTALPSKTATCLACQKPIIFAIGKDSRFGRRARDEAGCLLVESDKAEELADAIRRVKAGERENREGAFFLKYCGKTENSRRYAETITGAASPGSRNG